MFDLEGIEGSLQIDNNDSPLIIRSQILSAKTLVYFDGLPFCFMINLQK